MTSESRSEHLLAQEASGPRSFAWWGMVWLIMTEAALFAILIFSYFYLRFRQPSWPPAGIQPPSLALPVLMTAILWSSSLPVHLAERGIRRGSQTWLRGGLLAGFLLGASFLSLQFLVEYPRTLADFTPQANVYGSMFFVITGFHAFHVLVGLIFSIWTQVRSWMGAFTSSRHVTVQSFALYWHFVDVVWLFVLLTVYISPQT